MFDTYQMDPADLWEQVAELKRRGVPVPRELEDRLNIIRSEGGYTEVSKEVGPPYNPLNRGGFLDPQDPAQSAGLFGQPTNPTWRGGEWKRPKEWDEDQTTERRGPIDDIYRGAKGAAEAVKNYDTKGFGKGWNVNTRGVGKDWDKKAAEAAKGLSSPERRIEPDDAAGFSLPGEIGGLFKKAYYAMDDVASGLGEIDTRGWGKDADKRALKALTTKGDPAGWYPGISKADARALEGPQDPERPVRDMENLLQGVYAGLRNVANPDPSLQPGMTDTSQTYGVMDSDGLVGPPPPPPESVEEAVRQQAMPDDPSRVAPDVRQNAMPRVNDQIYSQVAEAMPQMPQVTDEWYKQNVSDDEGPKGFFDKGGKLDSFFGALSGFSPSTPAGQAIMAASLGMMSAPGTYGNFGAAFGKGGLAGLEQYGEAKKLEDLNAYKQEALDAQRKMAAQRNATEIWKATQANAGKMPEFAKVQLDALEKMAANGEVEAAQEAYDRNETLKILVPNWKAGRIMKSDEILVNQLRSNPNFLREWLNNEIKKGSTGSPMHDLVRKHLAHWEDPENNPALNDGEMNMLENYFRREGSASAAMGRGFEQYGMTTEEQVGKVREMSTPNIISPPRPGQQTDGGDQEVMKAAEQEGVRFQRDFMQKNGRAPSQEEFKKHLDEWYSRGGK